MEKKRNSAKVEGKKSVLRRNARGAASSQDCTLGMLETIEIKNFRCFEKLEIRGLKRMNIITGDNGSGKTALLEAILIGTRATPETIIQANRIRGLSEPSNFPLPIPIAGGVTPTAFRNIWSHLFRDETKNILIKYSDAARRNWVLGIYFSTEEATPAPLLGQGEREAESVRPIIFDRKDSAGKITKVTGSLSPQGQIMVTPASQFGPLAHPFMSMASASGDAIGWFSDLRMRGRSENVLQFVRDEFPYITNLEVLAPAAQQGIYATLTSGGTRNISLISAGLQRLFSIVAALADTRNGILLIDEIENGIFYEKYAATWAMLYKLAKDTESQIFISSHSAECLEALLPVLEADKNIEEFTLLRTERANGECVVRQISGASMRAALKRNGEIRGATIDGEAQAHS